MSSSGSAASLEELLAHATWVRRLATRLVRDAAAAEDLTQEVFLTALRERPTGLERPRAWLASVARTLAFTRGRAESRRAAREQRGASRGPAPSASELVVEAEREREVAQLVLGLDEPYRSVLLLRFYRDLPPRRIAAELGRPVGTVKVQLQRGLEHLRRELDQRHGGRGAWCALLLPLTLERASRAGVAAALAWAGTLVVVGGLVWWGRAWVVPQRAAFEPQSPRVELAGVDSGARAGEAPTPASARTAGRVGAEVPAPPRPTVSAVSGWRPAAAQPLRGTLLSLEGAPLPGVRVVVEDPGRLRWADDARTTILAKDFWLRVPAGVREQDGEAREAFLAQQFAEPDEARALLAGEPWPPESVVTDRAGRFEVPVRVTTARLWLDDEALALVGWGAPSDESAQGARVLFATAAARLEGRVVDADGEPCAGVRVAASSGCPPSLHGHLARGRGLSCAERSTSTAADGRFVLADVPRTALVNLTLSQGERTQYHPLDLAGGPPPTPLELTFLNVASEPLLRLVGTLQRPDGTPARLARVAFGDAQAGVDAEGRFELAVRDFGEHTPLAVVEPGYDPLLLEDYGAWLVDALGERSVGSLRLPETRLALAGTVVDAAGRPLSGANLRLADLHRVDGLQDPLEALAGGWGPFALATDAEGRFEVRGLLPRAYTIRVGDGADAVTLGPFQAGARDLFLRAPSR